MEKTTSKTKRTIYPIILIILLILLDQIIKYFVVNNLNSEIWIINNILSIKFVQNSGIAFGINSGNNSSNIIASIIVLIIVIKFMINQKNNITQYVKFLLCLIIAGGIGNITDRILYGAVIDFIDFWIIPTFNLADSYIVIGWILFIISVIKYSFRKRKRLR